MTKPELFPEPPAERGAWRFPHPALPDEIEDDDAADLAALLRALRSA